MWFLTLRLERSAAFSLPTPNFQPRTSALFSITYVPFRFWMVTRQTAPNWPRLVCPFLTLVISLVFLQIQTAHFASPLFLINNDVKVPGWVGPPPIRSPSIYT